MGSNSLLPFRWTTDREDLDTTDQAFQTWYVRSELVSTTYPIGQLCKTAGWRQQLNAHECVVNEVTVLVEHLKCALKVIKRLARAHSDLIVGVFAAGQPIYTNTERRGGKRRKTERRRRSVSGRRCYYRGWTTDREDLDTTDQAFQTWYVRSELVSTTYPIGQLCKTAGWRQQLNAHECVVNEVTVLVEHLKCALKATKRLARAYSDFIVGVFAAGQPIYTDTERRGGKRRKTGRR
ncbi:hypothetical protein LR48_Vigan598s000600 [Vigna angularis]|uniref:Uncharacterized protein n=1 Tax=Phaseolus angularis TaxID=3914 RepID=A0A0L9TE02_PHAAN|nr:hypothetical protein LR48_Vigan598s000600 [Vigna angularis]